MFRKNKRLTLLLLIPALAIAAILAGYFLLQHIDPPKKREDLARLSAEQYEAVFFSMYPIQNFAEEDFTTYRGLRTLKTSFVVQKTSDLSEYLYAALNSGNPVTTVYLGLDPEQLWRASRHSADRCRELLERDVLSYVTVHSNVTFEILLPFPSLEYWAGKDDADLEAALQAYGDVAEALASHTNAKVYFLGAEEWLISNPDNYEAEFTVHPQLSRKILLFTFCDGHYRWYPEDARTPLERLQSLTLAQKESPASYPDLSRYCIVFLGDSVIGNYSGSTSVPGIVRAFSHGDAYNCGIGGTSAARAEGGGIFSFPNMTELLAEGELPELGEDHPCRLAFQSYFEGDHSAQKLCFVVNYGLNDYFAGYPVENEADPYDCRTYAGALRTGIQNLQTAYPEAAIIIMAPTYTTLFSQGTEPLSEQGGVITDYVDAAVRTARETNVLYMNNYRDLGINEDTADALLEDGTHLNETGRMLLGKAIISFIAQNISPQ